MSARSGAAARYIAWQDERRSGWQTTDADDGTLPPAGTVCQPNQQPFSTSEG